MLVSWGIAFFEYCLAVPANRIGHAVYSAAELKTIQEVITLIVFAGFSVFYLKERSPGTTALGFAMIALGAFFIFHKWSGGAVAGSATGDAAVMARSGSLPQS